MLAPSLKTNRLLVAIDILNTMLSGPSLSYKA